MPCGHEQRAVLLQVKGPRPSRGSTLPAALAGGSVQPVAGVQAKG